MSILTATPTHVDFTAAGTSKQEHTTAVPLATAKRSERTIVQVLKVGIPLGMVAVFALTVLMFVVGGRPLGEAVGIGAYLSFWIGGGFGAILSGAYYDYKTGGLAQNS